MSLYAPAIAALKAAHAEQKRVAALSHELWESVRPVNKRLTTAVAVGLLKTFDGLSPMAVAQIVGKSKKSSAFVMTKAEFQCACKLAVEAGGKLPPSLAGRTDVPNVRFSDAAEAAAGDTYLSVVGNDGSGLKNCGSLASDSSDGDESEYLHVMQGLASDDDKEWEC